MKRKVFNNFRVAAAALLMMLLVGGGIGSATLTEKSSILQIKPVISAVQTNDAITITIPVGSYQIKSSANGDEVSLASFGRLLIPGKPNLPSKIFSIAIPPGAMFESIDSDTTDVLLSGSYEIAPSVLPRVIGQENPLIYEQELMRYTQNQKSVYDNNDPYPASVVEVVGTGGYRKYNLVDVRINPMTYYPISRTLVYHSVISVTVHYTVPEGFSSKDIMVDTLPQAERTAQDIILNYDQAKTWYPTGPQGRASYDYVVITTDALVDSVTPLVDWETAKGRSVNVITTTWIDQNYDGYDLAAKMRAFLVENYPSSAWGILDVLLVGDYNSVPMRHTTQNVGYGATETDYYYAELSLPDDQSWDANGNHRYGEDSDPIDFEAEVNVGRIPWNDPDTVFSICEKSVTYEQNSDNSFKKNILLLGAYFWPDTDNAVLMEAKVNQDWMTDWTMTRLYEDAQSSYPCDYDLNYNNVKSVWSAGTYAFVDWAGHGSESAAYEYYPSQPFVDEDTCTVLNNEYSSIIFADSCSNSDTDYLNIGQAMMKQGGVGFLGANKVAFGCPGWNNPMSGSSQSLDYFFTTCCTSGNYSQGQAHQYALRQMYVNNLWDYMRYEMFEWGSIWGNPDLGMMTHVLPKPPVTPNRPTGPTIGVIHQTYSYTATTPDDPDGSTVSLMMDWGDGTFSDWLGPYPEGQDVQSTHSWATPGIYGVRVKAKDVNNTESDWSEALGVTINAEPRIGITGIKGGIGVSVTVHNNVNTSFNNIPWTIALSDGFILVSQGTDGVLANVSAGQDATFKTGVILGFGRITITVTILEASKTASGLLIGPFLVGVR